MKYSLPLVSICIPAFNSSNFIIKTLDSVKAQSYPNFELIILDDFSKDATREVIYDWILSNSKIRITFICSLCNRGIIDTCAELFALINGEYFQFLGSDDILHPDKITNQVNTFQNLGEDYGLLFGDVNIINMEDDVLHDSYFLEQNINIEKVFIDGISLSLINHNFIPSPSVLIRTSAARNSGGINRDILFEDLDLYIRLSKYYKFGCLKEQLASYRRLTHSTMHMPASYVNVLEATLQCIYQYKDQIYWRKAIKEKVADLAPAVYMGNHQRGSFWVKIWFRQSFSFKSFIYLLFSFSHFKYSKK